MAAPWSPIPVVPALLAVSVLLLAGFVKGTLGFGVGLVSATLLLQFFPPKPTLMVLVFPIALSEIGLLVTTGVPWGLLRERGAFFLSLVPGAIVGALGLLVVPVDVLYLALSGYVLVFLALQRYESRTYRVAKRRGFGVVSGLASGFLGGGFGAAGPPAVPYLYINTRDDARPVFVGGMAAAFVVPQLVRLPLFVAAGRFGPRKFVLGGAAGLTVLAGLRLGSLLRPRIPEGTFQTVVKGALLLVAGQLAIDALA